MKNLETPVFKVAVYGAISGLGSAVMATALQRQHEVTAIVDDLNALTARPGLRSKQGDLTDAISVSQSVAGKDAVICLTSEWQSTERHKFSFQFRSLLALLDGLEVAGVKRLLVVDDCSWLDQPEALLPVPASYLRERLQASPVAWTLVEAPAPSPNLSVSDCAEGHELARPLLQFSAALLDETELSQHVRERVRIVEGEE